MKKDQAVFIKDLSFAYNGPYVLAEVNLALEQGAFISVVGPNGGGKTTLFKLILGLVKPQKGELSVLGRDPGKARRLIGYVAQYSSFDEYFPVTALEVVLMGRLDSNLLGRYGKQDMRKAEKSLADVGLHNIANIPFSELSGGQRQRVLIARALVTEPKLLLLDEPTSNIDVSVERKFASVLEELHKKMTIIMATHDVGFVSHLVKSVICVNKTVVLHPTSKLTTRIIDDLYGKKMRIIQHDKLCETEG
ncbi:MAG: ABC transporter ATP-binding protein [Spirochaetales bacterium]|nr:ABC transporter ATP-binding protein [Spirochaetales bacterium]